MANRNQRQVVEHKLLVKGLLEAKCLCGTWHYLGLDASSKKFLNDLYKYHLDGIPGLRKIKPKKKK